MDGIFCIQLLGCDDIRNLIYKILVFQDCLLHLKNGGIGFSHFLRRCVIENLQFQYCLLPGLLETHDLFLHILYIDAAIFLCISLVKSQFPDGYALGHLFPRQCNHTLYPLLFHSYLLLVISTIYFTRLRAFRQEK